jgi:hypothetical protein
VKDHLPDELDAEAVSPKPRSSGPPAGAGGLLDLQRSAGNRVTAALVKRSGALPPELQAGIETLSGVPVGDVRVHRGSAEPAKVNAHAYAAGDDIHLASGQDRHLAHEAWHVVQQRQGRVRETGRVAGRALNDDPALEAEASRMGEQAERLGRDLGKGGAGGT